MVVIILLSCFRLCYKSFSVSFVKPRLCLLYQICTPRCSEAQCPTLWDAMDCSLSGSCVHLDSPGKNIRVHSHSLLQGIFLTHGSNPSLLHGRQILYHLSHQGKKDTQMKLFQTTPHLVLPHLLLPPRGWVFLCCWSMARSYLMALVSQWFTEWGGS